MGMCSAPSQSWRGLLKADSQGGDGAEWDCTSGRKACLSDSGNGGECLFWQQVGECGGCSQSVLRMHD